MKKFDQEEYPNSELTSKIIKCAFEVYNELGYGLPERVYQKALASAMSIAGLSYVREAYGLIKFRDQPVGKYFLDFLVENSVAIELKVRNEIYEQHQIQLLNYLKAKKLRVGLILAITNDGVKIKRIANTISDKSA
jgi:GxxExxY protein